jgi:hypothetical protein
MEWRKGIEGFYGRGSNLLGLSLALGLIWGGEGRRRGKEGREMGAEKADTACRSERKLQKKKKLQRHEKRRVERRIIQFGISYRS